MKTPPLVLALLALAYLATATVAWQQYQRAERLTAALDTRTAPAAPGATPAATTSAPADEPMAEPSVRVVEEKEELIVAEAPGARATANPRGDPGARWQALMENPEFAAAWQSQQRARLDERYAALFRRLSLSPAELNQLKNLLADRQSARMDVMAAARSEGLGERADIRRLMEVAEAEVETSLQQLLGDGRYEQLQRYEQTAPQRTTVAQIEDRLSYSSAPLTSAQSDALVRILAETAPAGAQASFRPGGGGAAMPGARFPNNAVPITEATLTRAQGILSPAQLNGLRELQQEQQSQQQLRQMMDQQFRRERPNRPAN